jgi:general secretion pathway protein K
MSRLRRARQAGAALLLAMIILTLITTLAAGMVWQQWRGVQVEAAERARTQSAWILTGALDWARLILREDAKADRGQSVDHLGEPWAVPLAEARLSSFLAADRSNNASDEGGLDAFLSGAIADAQSRYNLRNLVNSENKLANDELLVLQRICEAAGVPDSTAQHIAEGLLKIANGTEDAPLDPKSAEQLTWLGVDPAEVKRLLPFVTVLPRDATKVNVNTAPREVIAAVVDGLDVGSAERLVQSRQREPFRDTENVKQQIGGAGQWDLKRLSVNTSYFEVQGQVRLGDRVLQERSLVKRQGSDVMVLRRERVNLLAGSNAG